MNVLSKLMLVGLVLAVSACTNSIGFDDTNSVDLNNPDGGLVSDQTSSAYFEQAIGDRVLFLVDQSSLTDVAKATLAAQANWLAQNSDYKVIIEGHADEQGTREYNLALGARRADAAREYLISQGIAGGRLQVVSYGKERPLEICSDETCYSNNRRAVTVLAGGLTG